MCESSLVPPKQSALSILVRSSYAMQLPIMYCNIIETRPRAASGAETFALTNKASQASFILLVRSQALALCSGLFCSHRPTLKQAGKETASTRMVAFFLPACFCFA